MKKYKVIQSGYKSIEGELNKNISSLNDAKLESMNVVGDLMVATISYNDISKHQLPKTKSKSKAEVEVEVESKQETNKSTKTTNKKQSG